MSLITIDEEKCKRDGICVDECPVKIIQMISKETVPVAIPGADLMCINCGHCVAVCPHGALTHKKMKPEQCPPVNKEWLLNPEQAEHFLRSRRSIRTYKEEAVEQRIIQKLINIASYAPTGHNSQPVEWLVVYKKDDVNMMTGLIVDWMRNVVEKQPKMAKSMGFELIVAGYEASLDIVLRGAPHLIVAHAPAGDSMAPSACNIAMTYLELAAPSFGLGACWAGFFQVASMLWKPLQETLGLPDRHKCYGAMMVGYPKYNYSRMPLRNKPKITWRE